MKAEDKIDKRKKFNNLLKRISQDEKQALDDLYSDYGKLIYWVAISTSKSEFLADEIVNDVLVRIWETAGTQPKIDNPSAWLYRVAKNCAIDRIKKEKQIYEIFDTLQDDTNLEKLEADDSFNFYISRLSEEEKQIFILHFTRDMTFKQIAKEIKKPLSTISSVYYRAKKKIRPLF